MTAAAAPATTNADRRRAARMAAVQALYQADIADVDAATVVAEFIHHRFAGDGDLPVAAEPDEEFFSDLVRGALGRCAILDSDVAGALRGNWTPERLERILLAILRCGAYELVARPDVPARVVINEYVDIAHAFFDSEQPSLVNGVLDALAAKARPGEIEARDPAAAK